MLLQSKVVLVTGGAGGIGSKVAAAMGRHGARVVVCDVGYAAGESENICDEAAMRGVKQIRVQGTDTVAIVADVSTETGACEAVKACIDAFGDIDIVVCAAGIAQAKTLLKMDEQLWSRTIQVGLTGTFLTMQAAAREMIERGHGGRMVVTTGIWGYLGQFSLASVAAVQGGIHGLMRTAAIEWQKHKITVNAIAPLAHTPMTQKLGLIEGFESLTVEHVVPSVLMLASDLCGDRTGHVLASAGPRVYSFRFVESAGKFKNETDGIFTPEEIDESFNIITKL